MRVLLIEDDSATAQSIELMLQSDGFNVYMTDLGEEGVDLGKLYDYDIILLDLNLPDMSGTDLQELLRARGSKVPVMLVGDQYRVEDEIDARSSGATMYFAKPLQREWLLASGQHAA